MDFEYILRGYMFRKGRMKITVSKIFKVGDIYFKFLMYLLIFNISFKDDGSR